MYTTVHPNTVQEFASAFAYGRNGLSLQELLDYFAQYQANVPSLHSLQHGTTKGSAFLECVASLSPENQRQALYDLCDHPPPAQHPMPKEEVRRDLLIHLMQGDGHSPLGTSLSELTLRDVRNQWFTAASRLPESPASAITAARALLETTCKTILQELCESPDRSGDLGKFYKLTRIQLAIGHTRGVSQAVHQIINGLTQVVEGTAAISNAAGDRHGLAEGERITELSIANLCVHAAGSVALFLTRAYKGMLRGPNETR
ncbi:MAG: abortive infection family protein [Deltaproteobacteria bacterium]|nr:abortive infection family protein [Deltaproteobacteria bacterium]